MSCPTRARAGAVPSLTPQPKCSPKGGEAKTGAGRAGSVQKGARGCPQPGSQHLLHRDKNVAIHVQHKAALSWITSGSPFLKPQPGNAIWLCKPSPRTSVHPLKAPDPSKCFPLTPSFGTGRDSLHAGLHAAPCSPVQSPRKTIHPAGARQMVCGRCAAWSSVTALFRVYFHD